MNVVFKVIAWLAQRYVLLWVVRRKEVSAVLIRGLYGEIEKVAFRSEDPKERAITFKAAVDAISRATVEAKPEAKRLVQPPGRRTHSVLAFLFSRRTVDGVFSPALADLRHEYYDAQVNGRLWHARWIHVRGVCSMVVAALNVLIIGFLRPLHEVVKTFRGN